MTKFVCIRLEGTHLSDTETSQSNIGDNSLGEARSDLKKLNSQQPVPEVFITVAQKDFDLKNDANTQSRSPPASVDEYLADPVDDQMYPVNPEMEQSTDAVGSSSLTESEKVILKRDRSHGPSNIAEELLPLLEESNMVHLERTEYVENPATIEEEKNGAELVSQEHINLGSSSGADVFDKQYSHDSLPQVTKLLLFILYIYNVNIEQSVFIYMISDLDVLLPLLIDLQNFKLQHAGNDQRHHSDCAPQLMPDPNQVVKEFENCSEMVSTSQVNSENIPQDGSEVINFFQVYCSSLKEYVNFCVYFAVFSCFPPSLNDFVYVCVLLVFNTK